MRKYLFALAIVSIPAYVLWLNDKPEKRKSCESIESVGCDCVKGHCRCGNEFGKTCDACWEESQRKSTKGK